MEEVGGHSGGGGSLSAAAAAAAQFFLANHLSSVDTISRATSPGVPFSAAPEEDGKKRYRPRTFRYFNLLPYPVEDDADRDVALRGILKKLYIAIKAEDFSPGALHWTRELQGWLNLKFEMTRELRAHLARLYYHLSLAPGLDANTADRFTKVLVTLTRLVPRLLARPRLHGQADPSTERSTTSSPARISHWTGGHFGRSSKVSSCHLRGPRTRGAGGVRKNTCCGYVFRASHTSTQGTGERCSKRFYLSSALRI